MKKIPIWIMGLLLLATMSAHAQDSQEAAKIRYLIASVETLEGATFIRNGREYDARAASDHLRLKLKNAGGRVKTAEDFIKYCGSKSSMTGEPYRMRLADGKTMKAELFFRDKLKAYGAARPQTP